MPLVDHSHRLTHGTPTYPGVPGPRIDNYLSFEESSHHYAEGTEFQILTIAMATATGTYLDAPRHRYRDGDTVADLSLSQCVELPALVITAPEEGPIGPEMLPTNVDGHAVLLHTDWDRWWETDTYGSHQHPHLTADAAKLLRDNRAALVGIDSVNIDATDHSERPVHSILLAAGIPIVENLTALSQAPASGATFTAAPLAIDPLPSVPVRAYSRF